MAVGSPPHHLKR
ncbi:hypothetical protein ACN47E_000558, partial [Coniothyrium glycines]